MLSKIKNKLLELWWKIDIYLFPITQRLGFHITKTHYYSPIPSTHELDNHVWRKQKYTSGIDFNDNEQVKLLSRFRKNYKSEYDKFPLFRKKGGSNTVFYLNNGFFESVDGEILYSMIRHFKPSRVIEIGAGYSTLVTASALVQNKNLDDKHSTFYSFEPYPQDFLNQKIDGLTRLKKIKAQNIPLSKFKTLKKNDILFIDSSHVAKIGSDVLYEYLEVLPNLEKGVIIHIHDIFLPSEYPRHWIVKHHRFSTEQYLLHAFLVFNDRFKVLWGSQYMQQNHPKALRKSFNSYGKSFAPESFWIQKIK